jgi:hypothetical protein
MRRSATQGLAWSDGPSSFSRISRTFASAQGSIKQSARGPGDEALARGEYSEHLLEASCFCPLHRTSRRRGKTAQAGQAVPGKIVDEKSGLPQGLGE